MKVTIKGTKYEVDFARVVELGVIKPVFAPRGVGSRFIGPNGEEYLIVSGTPGLEDWVDPQDYVGLICLTDGCRWSDFIFVGDDGELTEDEWNELTEDQPEMFKLIEKEK
jgi:hypothetical protein